MTSNVELHKFHKGKHLDLGLFSLRPFGISATPTKVTEVHNDWPAFTITQTLSIAKCTRQKMGVFIYVFMYDELSQVHGICSLVKALSPCVGQPCCGRPTSLWPSGAIDRSRSSDWPRKPLFYHELAASDWGFAGARREPTTPSPPVKKKKLPFTHVPKHTSNPQLETASFSMASHLYPTSKSLYCATSTYPGRPSVSRKSRRWVMAIFPTPRLVLTEEDSLKTHSLGSMCSRTEGGRHTWKSHRNKVD